MTIQEYREKLEALLTAVSTEQVPLSIGSMNVGEKLCQMDIAGQNCAVLAGTPDNITTAMVLCGMTPVGSATGLSVFCCALDALGLGDRKWHHAIQAQG